MTSNPFSDKEKISQSVIIGGRVRPESRTPYLLMKKQCTQKERVKWVRTNTNIAHNAIGCKHA